MTAEVAILNKSAVALAADSAVTISVGSKEQKIFDSADKLFELSDRNPIAVMINSDMSFMEAPIAVLVKKYRPTAPAFRRVRDAANHFLSYLNDFVVASPTRIEAETITDFASSIFKSINDRARDEWLRKIVDPDTNTLREEFLGDGEKEIPALADTEHTHQFEVLERAVSSLKDASFFGDQAPKFGTGLKATLRKIGQELMPVAPKNLVSRTVTLIERAMKKRGLPGSTTGLIIAGFGDDDLFPTLISFELYGVFCGRLKFAEVELVDIDRNGEKARVLPFAQREMVERFLYGLDRDIENEITEFARSAVPSIAEKIIGSIVIDDEERSALEREAKTAERAFYAGLEETAFASIRADSRSEIEDMVEFMPKPEMARMAEALVNLTSIKRRVSRGHETVGGPIDVAVVSKAEGFVWVKRKHYFPPELNQRYFDRMRAQTVEGVEES